MKERRGTYRSLTLVALPPAYSRVDTGLCTGIIVAEIELCRHHRSAGALFLFIGLCGYIMRWEWDITSLYACD